MHVFQRNLVSQLAVNINHFQTGHALAFDISLQIKHTTKGGFVPEQHGGEAEDTQSSLI